MRCYAGALLETCDSSSAADINAYIALIYYAKLSGITRCPLGQFAVMIVTKIKLHRGIVWVPSRTAALFGSPVATSVVLLAVVLVVSTKAFSFHNRSSINFVHRLKTIFATIAPCRIFKLSLN